MKQNVKRAAALLCLLASLCAGAEVAQTRERTFSVKYQDGAVERYQVVWTANVTTTVKEEGGSPVPYQGSVDNRRCAWSVASTIDRTVSLATRLGPTFPLPTMSRTFKEDFQNRGGQFMVAGARNESCKDATAFRESAIGEAKASIRALFERLTDADLESLKKEVQSKADVVTITVQ